MIERKREACGSDQWWKSRTWIWIISAQTLFRLPQGPWLCCPPMPAAPEELCKLAEPQSASFTLSTSWSSVECWHNPPLIISRNGEGAIMSQVWVTWKLFWIKLEADFLLRLYLNIGRSGGTGIIFNKKSHDKDLTDMDLESHSVWLHSLSLISSTLPLLPGRSTRWGQAASQNYLGRVVRRLNSQGFLNLQGKHCESESS